MPARADPEDRGKAVGGLAVEVGRARELRHLLDPASAALLDELDQAIARGDG